MRHNRRYASWLAVLTTVLLIATACGQDEAPSSGAQPVAEVSEDASEAGLDEGDSSNDPLADREVIRFTFTPDPVWSYMKDTGELAQWEEDNNIRLIENESWEAFDHLAGGHGDIGILGTAELPLVEELTESKLVAFGKYRHERVPLVRRAQDDYNTLRDVPEDTNICVRSSSGETIVWSVIADQLHNRDFRVGQGDFNLMLHDYFSMPELVSERDCRVAATMPEAAAGPLRSGDLEMMYDGQMPWEIYRDEICECDHKGLMSHLFVATEQWYEGHPEEAAAFLELWQRGLELWEENKAEIVSLYPDHFAVETEEDSGYLVDLMDGDRNWYTDSVYMDGSWIEEELRFYETMIDAGWLDENVELPTFESLTPAS